jgi:hypothetical protein
MIFFFLFFGKGLGISFYEILKTFFMSINVNDPGRNRPASEGIGNDPNLRDESAAQPGVSTMSDSDTDYLNEETTQSVSDNPGTSDFDDDELSDKDFEDDEEDDEI